MSTIVCFTTNSWVFPAFVLISKQTLRKQLAESIADKNAQGHQTEGLTDALAVTPDSYDALAAWVTKLAALPMRSDWSYVEPNDWDGIVAELDPVRPRGVIRPIDPAVAASRAEAAFIGSTVGCMLGKPIETHLTLDELKLALTRTGDWPLADYISGAALEAIGRRHESWRETIRENIEYVASDDDINYTVLGLMLLEQFGPDFTRDRLRRLWQLNVPLRWAFGPERNFLTKIGLKLASNDDDWSDAEFAAAVDQLNFGAEKCGAMIRADAYGYAFPGNPARAGELAWRDAGVTHQRTGIYGAMFAAAAIATAFVASEPLEIVRTAMQFVPQRSRLYRVIRSALADVEQATDWMNGYRRINAKYAAYGHCQIYQETATLINTLKFADDSGGDGVGSGVCIQVMQGNDTDSYGATVGSILGAYFGPGHLNDRWIQPFNDTIHVALGTFHETSLTKVALRMGSLPQLVGSFHDQPAKRIGDGASAD